MKLVRLAVLCVVVVSSVSVYAAIEPAVKDTYDSGCVVGFNTSGCFAYTGPQVTRWNGTDPSACKASVGEQRCRSCRIRYDENGNPMPYKVCAYVAENASCACKNSNAPACYGVGYCDYLM
jgi:hypothetical protein